MALIIVFIYKWNSETVKEAAVELLVAAPLEEAQASVETAINCFAVDKCVDERAVVDRAQSAFREET